MKYLGFVAIVSVLIVVISYFYKAQTASESLVSTLPVSTLSVSTLSSTPDNHDLNQPDSDNRVKSEYKGSVFEASLPDTSTTDDASITDIEKAAILKQEKELIELAKGYETARSNSEDRLAHRAKMQEKLAVYSKDVLPLALEKIKAAQSAN